MTDSKKTPLELVKESFLAINKLKKRVRQLESQKNEPIAIIGMACRFADGIKNPEEFWQALTEGRNTVKDVPLNRWDKEAYYDPDKNTASKMNLKKIGAIEHVDLFDPEFFSIIPREAENMDPQHRLLLEVSWEALEDAGILPESLVESNTGVFTSILNHDYSDLILLKGQESYANPYSALSYWGCIAAGRISYFLGLNGPNVAIDTGCSGSIITVHDACVSLRNRESDLALAGGCHLVLSPERVMNYVRVGVLSPSGACKTFSDDADGFAKGEGCGIIVLKRLSDAIRDKNRILAVIKGSAINHDGASAGLTAPSGPAQVKVIQAAQKSAGIKPADIDYIEAHGTGTPLGDPIEFRALNTVFKSSHSSDKPLLVGAVKTNLGHLEAAAGIASIIKVVLSFNHELIPPHINFKTLNKMIDLGVIPAKITLEASPWKRQDRPRIAGISSFSLSGSNAHMILEEAPPAELSDQGEGPYVLIFSARNEAALNQTIENYKDFLSLHPDTNLADVAYTLQIGRTHFECRKALLCLSPQQFEEGPLPKIAEEWLQGKAVDWMQQYSGQKRNILSLPTYPFQRSRYWAPILDQKSEEKTEPSVLKASELEFPKLQPEIKSQAQLENVRNLVLDVYSKTTKFALEKIDLEKHFSDYGLDSIAVTEMNEQLRIVFGDIPATLFYKYKNLNELINYFEEEYEAPIKLTQSSESPKLMTEIGSQDIAIIGMSGIFPQSDNLLEFWDHLKAGEDLVTGIPPDRINQLNSPFAKWGSFIKGVDEFDMDFFKIAPVEAKFTSPNERLFLQEAWRCIESAGYRPENLVSEKNARVGVFVGVTYNDYGFFADEAPYSENRTPPNAQTFSIANRISYFCNFTGPSISIDTACSSSLYALHLAVKSILDGECQVALAGGINLTLHASKYEMLKKWGFLASDGRCHSFGEGGDGYVPGEGVGVLLLKPLAKAIEDRDNILGVIKGTGVSQAGKSSGYYVPTPVAQTEAINIAVTPQFNCGKSGAFVSR